MDVSVQYAKSLSLLVQEVRAQANPDALRTLLIRARGYSRAAGLMVDLRDNQLLLEGRVTRMDTGGFDDLIQAMRQHGIARIGISEGASPKELLRLAVLLAKAPAQSKSDPTIFEDAREMSLWFVRLHPVEREVETEVAAGARELGGLDATLARAKAAELVQQIVDATQQNNDIRTAALLRLLMDAERVSVNARECWVHAFEEATTPAALRLVALALPSAGDDRSALLALLKRAGAAGANAVITQLMASDQVESRRAYFDAVVELQAGVPLLIDMLRHPQWYVVRNCALLLGEMRATDAVAMLGQMLSHADHRVRIAVSTALAQIDTPAARAALQQALRDESAEVRRRALRGFSGELGGASSAALVRALDKEEDPEVQVEILAAMGRIRSPDAVQKLIRLCSPMAGSSSGSFRIAAAEALTTARGQAAVPFLRAMLEDRDPNVRTTARALINSVTSSR